MPMGCVAVAVADATHGFIVEAGRCGEHWGKEPPSNLPSQPPEADASTNRCSDALPGSNCRRRQQAFLALILGQLQDGLA